MKSPRHIGIEPRDPLIARDGRPFGVTSGQRIRCLDWIPSSVAAGSLRTLLGRLQGGHFDPELVGHLKQLDCRGPLPIHAGRLFLPAPGDVALDTSGCPVALRPQRLSAGCGTDLEPGLLPAMAARALGKSDVPAWWSVDKVVKWLLTAGEIEPGFFAEQKEFRSHPPRAERTHLAVNSQTLASVDGMLFTSSGLELDDPEGTVLSMCIDEGAEPVFGQVWPRLPAFQSIGAERRIAAFREDPGAAGAWACPAAINECLEPITVGSRLRMVLASPAIFSAGWRPGWLNEDRIGSPPGLHSGSLVLRLVSTAIQRWEPVSGWSYEPLPKTHRPGPKAIRRLVPAGGVYFFEVVDCSNLDWNELWLMPVSDALQDRRDGFGLAVWGPWDEQKEPL